MRKIGGNRSHRAGNGSRQSGGPREEGRGLRRAAITRGMGVGRAPGRDARPVRARGDEPGRRKVERFAQPRIVGAGEPPLLVAEGAVGLQLPRRQGQAGSLGDKPVQKRGTQGIGLGGDPQGASPLHRGEEVNRGTHDARL